MVPAPLEITEWGRVTWRETFFSLEKAQHSSDNGFIFKSILKTKWYKITVDTVQLSTVDMTEALKTYKTKNIHSLFNI
jgi:hypothetical protein